MQALTCGAQKRVCCLFIQKMQASLEMSVPTNQQQSNPLRKMFFDVALRVV
jgi:flagellar biosynthesis regulator FlbT